MRSSTTTQELENKASSSCFLMHQYCAICIEGTKLKNVFVTIRQGMTLIFDDSLICIRSSQSSMVNTQAGVSETPTGGGKHPFIESAMAVINNLHSWQKKKKIIFTEDLLKILRYNQQSSLIGKF